MLIMTILIIILIIIIMIIIMVTLWVVIVCVDVKALLAFSVCRCKVRQSTLSILFTSLFTVDAVHCGLSLTSRHCLFPIYQSLHLSSHLFPGYLCFLFVCHLFVSHNVLVTLSFCGCWMSVCDVVDLCPHLIIWSRHVFNIQLWAFTSIYHCRPVRVWTLACLQWRWL